MLYTRRANREKVKFFSRELLYDICDGDQVVGTLGYDPRKYRGTLSYRRKSYVIELASERGDEMLYQAVLRVASGRGKKANPYLLKDSEGAVLAAAEPVKTRFAVTRDGESFLFRKASFFARPYHLYRAGSGQSLGWVGQKKFFATILHMDLPGEFDAPFQVFLLVLLLNASMKALENQSVQ